MLEAFGFLASRAFILLDAMGPIGVPLAMPEGPFRVLSPLAEVPGAALAPLSFAALIVLVLRAAMRATERARSGSGKGLETPRPRSSRAHNLRAGAAHAADDFRPAA